MNEEDHIVRLRGLPWAATVDDITNFLSGCSIAGGPQKGVHLVRNFDGRASGEAFVELQGDEDLKKAQSKNKEHIGKRYIDVFTVKKSEMDWTLNHSGPQDPEIANDAVVRLRGLPFGCSKEEIANFFTGLEILPNGITILTDHMGRTTGEAFVQFSQKESIQKALLKHKDCIGHRYIEIFPSSYDELMSSVAKMCRNTFGVGIGPPRGFPCGLNPMPLRGARGGGRFNVRGYDDFDRYGMQNMGAYGADFGMPMAAMNGFSMRGNMRGNGMGYNNMGGRGNFNQRGVNFRGGKRPYVTSGSGYRSTNRYESQTGHSIRMRGLPYSATEEDIAEFFSPLSLVSIVIDFNREGRPSGDANVDFTSHDDVIEAMKRNKASMKNRYIELFQNSTPGGGRYAAFRSTFGNGYGGGGSNYTAF